MCIRDSGRSSGRYYQPQQPSTTSQPQYQQYDQGASSGNYNDEYDDGASSGRSSARSYSSSRTSSSQRSGVDARAKPPVNGKKLSLIHISEPTRLLSISYAVFCLKKKKILSHDYD
eukprot:TRINITY_DN31148_c0_g1_i2.p1 TRINITY_DN31148_c0_g1~~TRINITY_DN31148_c0_g1_i2.p1  ORF type:complete len:116 (+),score=33.67 TRINITY_DN31148_c0_g1_i2:167-514(+)